MVRHNNIIPFGHFHKDWQARVKTWFSQPMEKQKRKKRRQRRQMRLAPKPVELLRPAVQCPTSRYNTKIRAGRGFTVLELKRAGFNVNFARTIGIAVDYRRRNRSNESLSTNIQRLKEYKARLVVFPKDGSKIAPFENDKGVNLNAIQIPKAKLRVARIGDEDKKFEVFNTLRKARADQKYWGMRLKRKLNVDALDKIPH